MARPALRAFSLVEVVIVVALLGLLVIMAERLLIPSLRMQRKETALAQTQQRLQLAQAEVRELLQSSGSGGLFFQNEMLSCQSLHEVMSDGELAWEVRPSLVCRDIQHRQLLRMDWKESPASVPGWSSSAPLALKSEDLLSLRNDSQHHQRMLANEIDLFKLTHDGTGLRVGRNIQVHLESWSGERHTIWNSSVSLRNSW